MTTISSSQAVSRVLDQRIVRHDLRATATFRLLAPAVLDVGYSGAVPVSNLLQ